MKKQDLVCALHSSENFLRLVKRLLSCGGAHTDIEARTNLKIALLAVWKIHLKLFDIQQPHLINEVTTTTSQDN